MKIFFLKRASNKAFKLYAKPKKRTRNEMLS